MRVAVDADGIIQAITAEHVGDVGAYAVCPAGMDPMLLPGPVQDAAPRVLDRDGVDQHHGQGRVPRPVDVRDDARARWRSTTSRREIGIDPAELRRRNLLAASDLPFTAPSGNVFQEITPLETLEQALEILDYDAFRKEQAEALAQGRYLGVGHLRVRGADVDGQQHAWPPRRPR